MNRTTSLLTTGALGIGTMALLGTVAPGVAAAGDCGVTQLDMAGLGSAFHVEGFTGVGGGATAEMLPAGLHLTMPSLADDPGEHAYAAYFMDGLAIPLADATAQSNYVLDATLAEGQPIENHPTYELYVDLDATDGVGPGETILVYWEPAPGDPEGIWWSAAGPLTELDPEGSQGTDEGTLVDISAAYPDATITSFGFQLLYQPGADVTVHGLTFGCNDFLFSSGPAPDPDPEPTNQAPTAAFTATATDATVAVDAAGSTDSDGLIAGYAWDFGNGATATGATASHTYAASGTYTVTLTVTDDGGAVGTTTQDVTVTVPGNGGGDPTDPTDPAAPTEYDTPLANTGADVIGMAVIGGLVLAGGGAGLVVSRRRKAGATS